MMKLANHLFQGGFVRRASRRLRRSGDATRKSVLRHAQQASSHQIQVRQCTRHEQSMGVLLQAPVARPGKAEDLLDDQEWMLDLGPDTRLRRVLPPFDFIDLALASGAAVGHVLCVGRAVLDDLALTLVGRITPDLGLLAVQQIGQARRVVDVRGCRCDGMNEFGPAIDADVRFHTEKPLIALLRLMHVRVALTVFILRRCRRADNRRIDNGAFAHLDTLGLKVIEDVLEQGLSEVVALKQMPKAADRGFVRRRAFPEVEAHEALHRDRIVEHVLGSRVGEIEPLLEKVNAQHHLQFSGRTAVAGDRIDRRDQLTQFRPGNDTVHLVQKLPTARRLRVLLEPFTQGQLLAHRLIRSVSVCLPIRSMTYELLSNLVFRQLNQAAT